MYVVETHNLRAPENLTPEHYMELPFHSYSIPGSTYLFKQDKEGVFESVKNRIKNFQDKKQQKASHNSETLSYFENVRASPWTFFIQFFLIDSNSSFYNSKYHKSEGFPFFTSYRVTNSFV